MGHGDCLFCPGKGEHAESGTHWPKKTNDNGHAVKI